MATATRHPNHQRNIEAKARRAMAVIDWLIREVFIPDPEVVDVTDRLEGLRMFSQELVARNSPAMWTLISHTDALLNSGSDAAHQPISYRESREPLFRLLNIAIEAERTPPAEIFDFS